MHRALFGHSIVVVVAGDVVVVAVEPCGVGQRPPQLAVGGAAVPPLGALAASGHGRRFGSHS